MLGSALYYPFIDVRDQAWLRSAILFWDKIQTIVPTTITKPYLNSDTQICASEGYLEPLYCELHPDVLEQLGKRVLGLLDQPGWFKKLVLDGPAADPSIRAMRSSAQIQHEIDRELNLVGIYPEKMSAGMKDAIVKAGVGRLHPAKASVLLRGVLDSQSSDLKKLFGYREEYEGDWILVNSTFAAAYMAALAAMLAQKARLSPLTSQESYQGLNLRFLIDEGMDPAPKHDANGVLLTVVMESLRIDPTAPVEKLIAFRRSRELQLAELSGMFDDLRAKIEKSEDQRELKEKAKRVFENKIRPGLEKLKTELSDQSIQSTWDGFYQSAMLSAPVGTAVASFAQSNSISLIGAGLFLSGINLAVKSLYARRKARASSPYTYLLDVQNKFSLPRYN